MREELDCLHALRVSGPALQLGQSGKVKPFGIVCLGDHVVRQLVAQWDDYLFEVQQPRPKVLTYWSTLHLARLSQSFQLDAGVHSFDKQLEVGARHGAKSERELV